MTVELGRIGIWRRRDQLTPRLAKEVEALGYGAIWIGGSPPADLFLARGAARRHQPPRRRHRHREHVDRARHRGRGVAPPDHRGPPRPFPARRRHRPSRGHAGVPQPLRHDRRLPRRPRRRGRARRGPGARRARARRCWRWPPSAPRGRTPTSPRPSTPRHAREILGDGPAARPRAEGGARHRPRRGPRARPARRRPPLPAPAQLHEQPQAAGLDRRRPRRRRQRRADRRARRAR